MCSNIIGIGARTAGPIGTGEAPFDVPEQRKDYDGNFRVTGGIWHVTRTILQTCIKYLVKAAGQTNIWIWLKLGAPIATIVGHVSLGKRRWRPHHTCERHVNSDFISLLFAQERPVQSRPGRCHST